MSTRNESTDGQDPLLLDTAEQLAAVIDRLRLQPAIALDTESDSLYSYYPKVCLIQISTLDDTAVDGIPDNPDISDNYGDPDDPNDGTADAQEVDPNAVVDFLIDPLTLREHGEVEALALLGELLADPEQQVIMHAAENDITTLQRDFGFRFRNIFDTQLAARVLGQKRIGLASMLEAEFGVRSNKRMQRTNWGQRPLSADQLAYARTDTHYLLTLRDRLRARLIEAKRWRMAVPAFARLETIEAGDDPTDERTFWRTKGLRDLPRTRLGLLQALWRQREREAQRRDVPPFKVMRDEALVKLARVAPTNRRALERAGLSRSQLERHGDRLLATIAEHRDDPAPKPPPRRRRGTPLSPEGQAAFDALRTWRTVTAQEMGVATDRVFTNRVLDRIVRRNPRSVDALAQIDGVEAWQIDEYGEALLAKLLAALPDGTASEESDRG